MLTWVYSDSLFTDGEGYFTRAAVAAASPRGPVRAKFPLLPTPRPSLKKLVERDVINRRRDTSSSSSRFVSTYSESRKPTRSIRTRHGLFAVIFFFFLSFRRFRSGSKRKAFEKRARERPADSSGRETSRSTDAVAAGGSLVGSSRAPDGTTRGGPC